MFLTGPCFSDEIENITCLFTDKNGDVTHFELPDGREINIIINGITVQQKAVCPLPLFRTLGNHTVIITLNDNTTYSAFFEVGMLVRCCNNYIHVIPWYVSKKL